jgi:hypothetical protein
LVIDWIRKLVTDEWNRRRDIEGTTLSVVEDGLSALHIQLRLGKIKKSSSKREEVGRCRRK